MNLENSEMNEVETSAMIDTADKIERLRFVSFNQDYTTLTIGSNDGFKIISLKSPDKLEVVYNYRGEALIIVERLFSSSLLAIVTEKLPRRLKICHFKKESEICNYSYPSAIVAIRMNRLRLVVCLESSLHIHNIRDMMILHTIKETSPNPNGVFALSNDMNQSLLAYPSSIDSGTIQLFDTTNLRASIAIAAHETAVTAICFNNANTLFATASIKGTIIRLFDVSSGKKLYEFRRGVKRCVNIQDLRFCLDGDLICSSSNTETVHIFKRETEEKKMNHIDSTKKLNRNTDIESKSWSEYFGSALKSSAAMLPGNVSEILTQTRAFAVAYLLSPNLSTKVAIIETAPNITKLYVSSLEGFLYIYDINMETGGECTLYRQYKLDDRIEDRNYDDSLPIDAAVDISISQIKKMSEDDKVAYIDPLKSNIKPLIPPVIPPMSFEPISSLTKSNLISNSLSDNEFDVDLSLSVNGNTKTINLSQDLMDI
ncbi:Autophagy-related protein 18 [Intoshia linei]|uniref:Autophagy-related protein 18 n=1 Tax=Intoshia linei TaxID=1819745 RepID=A0A177B8S7_9BILA|nr:Autophagy-related protein 18 [Intoshia linei]